MNLPTQDQVVAAGRHAISFAGGGIAMFAALHLITGGDAQSATNALNQIGHGMSEIALGIGSLMTVASAAYASLSANPLWQLIKGATAVTNNPALAKNTTVAQQATVATAAQEMPGVKAVLATPEVAKQSPSDNVVASPTELKK